MDSSPSIISTANLKCSICENYLSYFPIYLTTSKKNICGRCKITKEENITVINNEVFEAIAKDVKFPCRYASEGCVEKFFPSNIPNHESVCSYRFVKCPLNHFGLCEEQVAYCKVNEHCRNKHLDVVLEAGDFTIDLTTSEESHNIFMEGNIRLILKKKFDSTENMLSWVIYLFESDDLGSAKCKMLLTNNHNCIMTECVVETLSSEKKMNRSISLDLFKGVEQSSPIVKGKLALSGSVITKSNSGQFYYQLVEILKCSSCLKYIETKNDRYYLVDQKTLCSSCAGSGKKKTVVYDMRLILLASTELIYPCQYEFIGCTYTSSIANLQGHESKCKYGPSSCSLSWSKCQWHGLKKEVPLHLAMRHPEKLCTLNASSPFAIDIFNDYGGYRDYSIMWNIQFGRHYFRLNFSPWDKTYCWSLQMLGEFQEGFKYELDVFQPSKLSIFDRDKISVIKPCLPFIPGSFSFKDADVKDYCYFELNQIEHFFENGKLHFNVRIFKC